MTATITLTPGQTVQLEDASEEKVYRRAVVRGRSEQPLGPGWSFQITPTRRRFIYERDLTQVRPGYLLAC